MNGPLVSLAEAVDRLVDALSAQDDRRAAITDCAVEMADQFNNYAYTLEKEHDEDD